MRGTIQSQINSRRPSPQLSQLFQLLSTAQFSTPKPDSIHRNFSLYHSQLILSSLPIVNFVITAPNSQLPTPNSQLPTPNSMNHPTLSYIQNHERNNSTSNNFITSISQLSQLFQLLSTPFNFPTLNSQA